MTKAKCGRAAQSQSRDRKQPKGTKARKSLTTIKASKVSQPPALLILCVLLPLCLTGCFFVTNMSGDKVMANLTLKIANWFELQTSLTKTMK
jgi:hypothetical protein